MHAQILINTINLRKKRKEKPYILLLGAGCSISSGCPSASELVKKIIKDNELVLDPSNSTLENIEDVIKGKTLNQNLQGYFSDSNPSEGYWFLSELIKMGYFDLILTTNFDTCLEKTLGKIVNYDEFRLYIRGDISDKRINELIKLPPKIKIIKLHGDYQSRNMIVNPKDLWEIEDPLKNTLSEMIKQRGIIIIGCSMHDISIIRPLQKDFDSDYWYVDINPPDPLTKSILGSTLIKDGHIISGDEGDFNNFFSLLSKRLGDILDSNKKLFDSNKDKIIETCKIQEVDTYKLFADLHYLCQKVKEKRFENLVFIHDPSAPGGSELLKLIEKRHPEILKNKNISKLYIEGRGDKERKVTKLEQIIDTPNPPQRYLLIDSVSFSGNTLEMSREYLIDKNGKDTVVEAAVIYSGRSQEKKLLDINYYFNGRFLKVDPINIYKILFPWGLTQATDSICIEEPNLDTIDKYIPHKYFSFLLRPWGNILSLMENKQITVKILYLNPREMTSKHKHFCRNEIFLVIDERVILQVWDEHILLRKDNSFRVPVGTEHRLIGLDEPCRVLEICQGYNNQVEDIKRTEDKYGRVDKKGNV